MTTTTATPEIVETHVAIVGTYRGTDTPARVEYLTPDYDLAERIAHWTRSGWRDVHAARETVAYERLTDAEAEAERTPAP